MIEFNVIWLTSILGLLISFFGIALIAKFLVKPIDEQSFSFKRVFPFEVINHLDKGFKTYKIFLFLFSAFCFSSLIVSINVDSFYENFRVLNYIISGMFGLAGIVFVFLNLFNPSNVKTHLVLAVVFACLIFSLGLLIFLDSMFLQDALALVGTSSIKTLIFGSIALAFGLFEIVSIFTFKLNKWPNLIKDNEIVKRPDFFPLAAFEWWTLIIFVGEQICFLFVILA